MSNADEIAYLDALDRIESDYHGLADPDIPPELLWAAERRRAFLARGIPPPDAETVARVTRLLDPERLRQSA